MTYVIAEIGVNHNNNLNISKKLLIFVLKKKVNAVKFQTFQARNTCIKSTPKLSISFVQKMIQKATIKEVLKNLNLVKQIIDTY